MGREHLSLSNRLEDVPRFEAADFIRGIDTYLHASSENSTLRSYQQIAFSALRGFFEEDLWRGYVTHPTGTGKTVLFVEFSKALQEARNAEGATPKILVVTPTKDLVYQTIGQKEKKGQKGKGYGHFAPQLQVGSFFSDSSEKERKTLANNDVTVTTYQSFNIMRRREELRQPTRTESEKLLEEQIDEFLVNYGTSFMMLDQQLNLFYDAVKTEKKVPTGETLLDLYDVFLLDEGHHAMGKTASDTIDMIPPHKPIIAFTATPDSSEKKKLSRRLPKRIHDFPVHGAISMGFLAPLTALGINSDVRMQGDDLFGIEGDFLDSKVNFLAQSPSRNRQIIEAAKVMAGLGIGTVVSCMAGAEALHAEMIAERLREEGVKAEAVHGKIPTAQRLEIYKAFESGHIDVLTFVEVLGEGWDSDRAKAIIRSRPTRSQIIAQQHLGRILRPGDLAFSIDIIDEHSPLNPPMTTADVIKQGHINKGQVFGEVTSEQREFIEQVIGHLALAVPLADIVRADYQTFQEVADKYPQIRNGNLASNEGHYSISNKLSSKHIGLSDEIIEKIWAMYGEPADKKLGTLNLAVRNVYHASKTQDLLKKLPSCDPSRMFNSGNGPSKQKWISSEGLVVFLGSKYPDVDDKLMGDMLDQLGDSFEWRPLTHEMRTSASPVQYRQTRVYKAYLFTDEFVGALRSRLDTYLDEYSDFEEEVKRI